MSWILRCIGGIAALCLVAGCSSGSSASSTIPGPNPGSTTVTVTTAEGTRLLDIPVTLSTGLDNNQPTGVIATKPTNSFGEVTFSNLPASQQLCACAVTTQGGGTVYRTSHCAQPFPGAYTLKFSSKMPGS